jgi:hypothetical protein
MVLPLAPAPILAQSRSFTEFYNDTTMDEFHGVYGPVMSVFDSPGAAGATPAAIRELISNDPRSSSMGYLVLVLPPNAPNSPGLIYGMHSVAKYVTRLGQPATLWDDGLFASIHDVVGNQIPSTMQFPADAFARLGQGAHYCVPLQLLDMNFATDPNMATVGPYNNHDAGTELIESCNVVGVPHCYIRHFVPPGPLTPRLAWEMVADDIITNGDMAACASLMDFFRLLCTLHLVGDTSSPLTMNPFVVPLADTNLLRHRTDLIQHKRPGLNQTPTLAAGQAIATSVSKLATKQRAYRQDMANRHAQTSQKTIEEYFGASLHSLLCVCNVEQ